LISANCYLFNTEKMNIKETNITVSISNMDKSIEFYTSIGFEEKTRWGNHYAKLQMQGIILGLHPTAKENLHGNSGNLSIGFQVFDSEEAKQLLETLSIPFHERNEEGGNFIHFADPDGNSLYYVKTKW
jgi:catechol 2,3-dioxygenase-like lactoylglutathione lyase family enzyme